MDWNTGGDTYWWALCWGQAAAAAPARPAACRPPAAWQRAPAMRRATPHPRRCPAGCRGFYGASKVARITAAGEKGVFAGPFPGVVSGVAVDRSDDSVWVGLFNTNPGEPLQRRRQPVGRRRGSAGAPAPPQEGRLGCGRGGARPGRA